MENQIKKYITYAYWGIMLIVYPLILHDKYFDVSDTKLYVFYIASFIMVAAMTILQYVLFDNKFSINKVNGICTSVLILSFAISLIRLGDLSQALKNETEYGVGIIFLVLVLLVCFCVQKFVANEMLFSIMAMIGLVGVFIVSFLQFVGADPWNMIVVINEKMQNLFMGTLGNISFTGYYFVIMFPIAVYMLSIKATKLLGAACVAASTMGIIMANTDGTILAFSVGLLVTIIVLLKNEKYVHCAYEVLILIGISFGILKVITKLDTDARQLDAVPAMMISWIVILLFIAIGLVGLLINYRFNNLSQAINKGFFVLTVATLCVVCLLPVIICIYTLTHDNGTGSFGAFLYFDEHWGTDRGYLWSAALDMFKNGSIVEKLFGRGAGSFATVYMAEYYPISKQLGVFANSDAHNIFLQFLCEYGLLGCGAMITMIIFRVKSLLLSENNNLDQFKAIALMGASVASMFLVVQPITIGMMVMLV